MRVYPLPVAVACPFPPYTAISRKVVVAKICIGEISTKRNFACNRNGL